jgi:Zn-dependent protease
MAEGETGALRFDRALFAGDARGTPCSNCKGRLGDAYWKWQQYVVCERCGAGIARQLAVTHSAARFGEAALVGSGAALACGLAYAAFVAMTKTQLALATIGIAYVVAGAVRKVSGGVGDRRFRLLAVLLTYVASTMGYAPMIGHAPGAGFLVVMLMAPFLDLGRSPFGLVIVGFGLWEAWRRTGGPSPVVDGPYRIGPRDIERNATSTHDGASPRCDECGTELAPGLVSCPECSRLVGGAELDRLASAADEAERAGDRSLALASWRRALDLLPAASRQAAVVHEKMKVLSAEVDGRRPSNQPPASKSSRRAPGAKAGTAAGAGVVGLALLKSKAFLAALLANGKLLFLGLLKLPTLLSMLVFLRWGSGGGVAFAAGLVATIYVHEMGHVAALRRYGIEASAPMFIPGFGALVRLKQYPTDAHEDARTGLAGPLWGLFAAAVAACLGRAFGWSTATAVASVAAMINCFNLVPVWQLDGSRGLRALSRAERVAIAAVGVATGAVLHQAMPAIVGAVAAMRAAGRGGHPNGDRRVFELFAFLIVAHGMLGTLPGPTLLPRIAAAPALARP